jgi:hypothetical protein
MLSKCLCLHTNKHVIYSEVYIATVQSYQNTILLGLKIKHEFFNNMYRGLIMNILDKTVCLLEVIIALTYFNATKYFYYLYSIDLKQLITFLDQMCPFRKIKATSRKVLDYN